MWPAASLNGSEAPPGACGTDGAAHYATTCLCRGLSEGSTSLCGLCRLVGAVWPLYGRLFLRDRLRRVCWRAVRLFGTELRVPRAVPRRPASPYPRRGSTRTRGPLVLGPTCDNSSGFSHTPFTRTVSNFQMPSRNKMAHLLWWGSLLERGRAPGLCELWRRASRSSPTAPSAAAAASATATVDGAPLLAVSRTSGTLVRRAPSRRPCRYEACR